MERGQDPEDFLMVEDLRKRPHRMEVNISDERFQDTILQGLTDDYDYIRGPHHRDRTIGPEIKTTMNNVYSR